LVHLVPGRFFSRCRFLFVPSPGNRRFLGHFRRLFSLCGLTSLSSKPWIFHPSVVLVSSLLSATVIGLVRSALFPPLRRRSRLFAFFVFCAALFAFFAGTVISKLSNYLLEVSLVRSTWRKRKCFERQDSPDLCCGRERMLRFLKYPSSTNSRESFLRFQVSLSLL